MSNETGATPEQIATAVRSRHEETSFMRKELPWDRMSSHLRATSCAMFTRDAAQWLVPPTHRIVAVDDLAALLDEVSFWAGDEICRPESVYLIDRIEALIGGE